MAPVGTFWQRVTLGAGVGVVATIAYRGTQHATAARAVLREECWSWQWLPFAPEWVWPYLSMFVIVGLPWFLLPEWAQVKRFAQHLLLMAAVGWVGFLLYPTGCVRPPVDGQPFYYAALQALDGANNCLPCLHSAMSVLAAWVLAEEAPLFHGRVGRGLLGAWLGLICVAIVALRQHTDVDTLVGVVLGAVAAWRWSAGRDAG